MDASFSYDDFAASLERLDTFDERQIVSAVNNVTRWIEAVQSEYMGFYRRFALLTAVGAKTYSKHYALEAISNDNVASKSATRVASMLFSYITETLQEALMWAVLDNFTLRMMQGFDCLERHENPAEADSKFRTLFGVHTRVVAVDFHRPIGASGGTQSQHGCIDFDFSTPQFHIYPVSQSEYDASTLRCHVQGWRYGLKR